jgi:hypothetical protein
MADLLAPLYQDGNGSLDLSWATLVKHKNNNHKIEQ